MSRSLSMNCGSGERLNASVWCGLRPKARQIRLTADWLIPVAAAIDLVDQCVAPPAAPQSVSDHPLHLLVPDRARLPRPWLAMQPVEATSRKTGPPLPDRVVWLQPSSAAISWPARPSDTSRSTGMHILVFLLAAGDAIVQLESGEESWLMRPVRL